MHLAFSGLYCSKKTPAKQLNALNILKIHDHNNTWKLFSLSHAAIIFIMAEFMDCLKTLLKTFTEDFFCSLPIL